MSGCFWSVPPQNHVIPRPSEDGGAPMLVLFDVDGTLVDGARDIVATMIEAFEAAGESAPDPVAIKGLIGLSPPELVAHLTEGLPRDRADVILAGYRLRYFDAVERLDEVPAFPGAERSMALLRQEGLTLGLATGKARRGVFHMLRMMSCPTTFDTVQTADGNRSKPDPQMIQRAMAETGFGPDATVLVGDSRQDMRMARAAGVGAIGVAWGYNDPDELLSEGAISIARDFDHLTEILLSLRSEMRGTDSGPRGHPPSSEWANA